MTFIVTSNQQALPIQDESKIRANLSTLKTALKKDFILGLQEMYPKPYIDALEKSGLDHIGKKGEPAQPKVLGGAAIAWSDDWECVHHGHAAFYQGSAGISYTRYISWVLLEKNGHRILMTDRQYPAKAWSPDGSSHARPDESRANQRKRQRLWKSANKADKRFIRKLIKQHNYIPSAHVGDMNRSGKNKIFGTYLRPVLRTFKINYHSHGLDYVALVDGSSQKWSVRKTGSVKVHSDHAAFYVDADLVVK